MKIKSGVYHIQKKINGKYYIAEVTWQNNKKMVKIIYPKVIPDYDKMIMAMKHFLTRFEFIERINVYDKF